MNKNSLKMELKYGRTPWQYIDPIGMLLYLFCNAGFSKSPIFLLRDKRTSRNLGISGMFSLVIVFCLFCLIGSILTGVHAPGTDTPGLYYLFYFLNSLVFRVALFSFSGLLVNCFPLPAFDMGLILTGQSVDNLIKLIKIELPVKASMTAIIVIGFIYEVSYQITRLFIF